MDCTIFARVKNRDTMAFLKEYNKINLIILSGSTINPPRLKISPYNITKYVGKYNFIT